MKPQVTILSAALWVLPAAAVLATDVGPPAPAAHLRKKPARQRDAATPIAAPKPDVTPMFGESDHPETAAEQAASLERRRKAFFAAPATEDTSSSSPVGVTLGGSNGLTPGMGLTF